MTHALRQRLLLGSLLLAATTPAAAIDLVAKPVTTTLPDGVSVIVLAYVTSPDVTVGPPGGPVLYVNQGDTVTVNLTNGLAEPTGIHFQGQPMRPDVAGVSPGATGTYTFTAASPGTFLYEAGIVPGSQHQAARGLHGALVVRPAGAPTQAYASAASAFDDEAVLVLGEIDPALHASASPAAFDMRDYQPWYFLLNGKAYPATDPIPTAPGRRVLVRFLNAGLQQHSMTLLGAQQFLVGKDGNELAHPVLRVAETVAPGETLDAIVTIPAGTPSGSKLAVFDGSLKLYNARAAGFGGMLTFLAAGAPVVGGPDTVGPAATAVAIGPVTAGSATLTATITDAASGGSNVVAAEYRIDAAAAGTPMSATDGSFNSPVEAVTASVNVAGLSSGTHTITVRGQDAAGNWGAVGSTVLSVDTAGPATSALVLTPSAAKGNAAVAISGTGSDQATGNASVVGAEYFVDTAGATGTGTAITASPGTSPVASLSGSIAAARIAALADGSHPILVHARDAQGNWGPMATVNLVVDKSVGPALSGVAANPAATNGTTGFNSTMAVIRVTGTATDALSAVVAAEGFVDVLGAPGTGFVFVPSDGAWNGLSEAIYGDIPLSTVNALANGTHTIYVRARDAAGNWTSPPATVSLLLDRTAPTFTALTLAPGTVAQGQAVTVTATGATDPATGGPASGVARIQYWVDGTSTPPAGTPDFPGTSASYTASTGGTHTVYARVRDAAGNWSAVRSATLQVLQAVPDATAFNANNNATQNVDRNAGVGVLANDLPTGLAGRTATLASVPGRVSGSGSGTIALSCPSALGTPGPVVPSTTHRICTNGAYRVTLTGSGATGAQRAASKRGTYSFTYTESAAGATTAPATVTITVN